MLSKLSNIIVVLLYLAISVFAMVMHTIMKFDMFISLLPYRYSPFLECLLYQTLLYT